MPCHPLPLPPQDPRTNQGGVGPRPVPLDEVGSRVVAPTHHPKNPERAGGAAHRRLARRPPGGLTTRSRLLTTPAPDDAPEASPWGGAALWHGYIPVPLQWSEPSVFSRGYWNRVFRAPGSPCRERARSVAGCGGVQGMWPAPELRPRPPPDPRGFASVDRSLTLKGGTAHHHHEP